MKFKELALHKIQSIIDDLSKEKLSISELIEKKYNYEIEIIRAKHKVKILVYFGKKGIKTIFQGNEESVFYKEIKKLVSLQQELNFIEKDFEEPHEYIGTDESGKGDFFGPLVVAGVYLNENIRKELLSWNVRDSKEISDTEIKVLAKKIMGLPNIVYNKLNIIPEIYNNLYVKYKNLNVILRLAHQKVITEILKKRNCEFVIIDKFGKYDFDLGVKNSSVEIKLITRGEKFTAVAAASILARNEMLNWFDDFKKKYKFELPKGASDENIISVAKKINKSELKNFAKLHFKTIKKVI